MIRQGKRRRDGTAACGPALSLERQGAIILKTAVAARQRQRDGGEIEEIGDRRVAQQQLVASERSPRIPAFRNSRRHNGHSWQNQGVEVGEPRIHGAHHGNQSAQ
jgi:hypothetical protein